MDKKQEAAGIGSYTVTTKIPDCGSTPMCVECRKKMVATYAAERIKGNTKGYPFRYLESTWRQTKCPAAITTEEYLL